MFYIIVACNSNNGIGYDGRIPWKCEEDLKFFKETTMNKPIIVGRKTAESLPYLPNREVLCLTKHGRLNKDLNNCRIFTRLIDILSYCEKYKDDIVYVCGGESIYKLFLEHNLIKTCLVSYIPDNSICDKFFYIDEDKFKSVTIKDFDTFILTKYTYYNREEEDYLNLLREVLEKGKIKQGRNGNTYSLFGKTLTFDLRKGFPLLTTKQMFLRGIIEELLFFLRGDTDSTKLEEKNISIWKGNTNREFLDTHNFKERKEGLMGPMYGYQWRNFNSRYDEKTGKPANQGFDQLKNLIDRIKKDKESRRHLMTDFNPLQADEGVLFPCHSIILHFNVDDDHLDMSCYNRSQDLFLGTPFNIASSALLLMIISNVCELKPGKMILNLGDCHIYDKSDHIQSVKTQIERFPFPFPKLELWKDLKNINDIENLTIEDFRLYSYNHHEKLKALMVA